LSFFDDDDDETVSASTRSTRTPPRPRPRAAQRPRAHTQTDQHTLMVRRRIAFGAGLALIILVILLISGCLKSEKHQALETYNQNISRIIGESDQQVSGPFFTTLSSASSSSPLNVELQVDQLRSLAQNQASSAKKLNVPSGMQAAQQDFLEVLDLRSEGLTKIANLVRTALAGQSSRAISQIAGDMELFLASDVIYSQRVVPLISQTLAANGITSQSTPSSRFTPNLGWLESATVQSRLTGQSSSSSSQSGSLAPGTHGSALKGVTVGGKALEVEPTLNRVKGGANPALTVMVEDAGENTESDVKVNVSVTSAGSTRKAAHTINKTEPGKTVPVDIPVEGVPLEVASKVTVEIEKVPGEENLENNKGSYVVVFEK